MPYAVQNKDRISRVVVINVLGMWAGCGVFGTGQRVYGYSIIFPFILSKNDAL